SGTMRFLVELEPQLFVAFEPVVRFVSDTIPATLTLQSIAGLALAWQWHRRVARRPFGPGLGPFREFRFGDHWVWALVAALTVWDSAAAAAPQRNDRKDRDGDHPARGRAAPRPRGRDREGKGRLRAQLSPAQGARLPGHRGQQEADHLRSGAVGQAAPRREG